MSMLSTGHEQMTDIHMHLIPRVDDGAVDQNMALSLMLRARDEGINVIFATPHSSAFDWDPDLVQEEFQILRQNRARFFPDMELYLGCEVYCDAFHMDTVLQGLQAGRYPGLNGTKYLLTEFSMRTLPEQALACVSALVDAGWIPVIAHMERYRYLRHNMELLDRFRAMGCLIQINAYSLSDETDEDIISWAREIVTTRKADFLGTDAHRTYHRPPSAARGLAWLYETCPKEYADNLCFANAQKYLANT